MIRRILEKEPDVKQIISIDYASRMLVQCQKELEKLYPYVNSKVVLIEHDITKGIPLREKSVDKCISNWGISYFSEESIQRVIFEIRRILKPGGYFICAALVKDANLARLKRVFSLPQVLKNWRLIKKATQFSKDLEKYFPAYSTKELRSMLEKSNFIIEGSYFTLDGGSITLIAR